MKAETSGNPPKHMSGNMKKAKVAGTPAEAIGRPGGTIGVIIGDKVKTTKVAKSSLTKGMP